MIETIAITAIIISVGSLLFNIAFSLWMELRRKKRAADRSGK
jgi:hypothetical protein